MCCMAITTIDETLGDVLENRYASLHVGGAFDAKNIPKPKTIEQSLNDATFGRHTDESLMIDGIDLTRYIRHDDIIPEKKSPPALENRIIKPKRIETKPTIRVVILPPSPALVGYHKSNFSPEIPEAKRGIRTPSIKPTSFGQNMRSTSTRTETGSGKPGVPKPKLFIPTPPLPFEIVPGPKPPIFWNTDPDMWDYTGFRIGQTFWDSQSVF